VAQFGFLLVDGVILSAAAFQAERRISHAHASVYGRSLTRLNCAGFREDAPQASTRFKLSYYRGDYLCIFFPERLLHRNGSVDPAGVETRICTLTESRATRCTTGPEGSV
jgi:hypothetical protein